MLATSHSLRTPQLGRYHKFSSPPPRLGSAQPAATPVEVDTVDIAEAKPQKPSFLQHLGRFGLSLLGLTGTVIGAAGAVTVYQQMRASDEVCLCSEANHLETPKFEGDVQAYSDALMRQTFQKAPSCQGLDRHEVGDRLLSEGGRVKYDGSKVVLIAFDGTFSHEPRRAPVMQELSRNLQEQGFNTASDNYRPADIVGHSITSVTGKPTRWTGLGYGVLQQIVKDPELNQNIQILTFPSEELEVLASPSAWKEIMPFQLARQVYDTASDQPRNVERALQAVRDIRQQAQEQGLSPKFVVVSHSSGGVSAGKFARHLESELGSEVNIDFVATIDPVKEAHFAAGEAVMELAEEGVDRIRGAVTEWAGGVSTDGHTPIVRSALQPESLEATPNVGEWVNFYQTSDILGVKAGPQLGIQGSPVSKAENVRLEDSGEGGHGTIAIDKRVNERIIEELRERIR